MRPTDLACLCLVLAAICLPAGGALADRAAADRCAASLSGPSKAMYDGALPGVAGGTAIPDALRGVARGMVLSGSITRDAARPMADAAGACLTQLR